MKIVLVGYGKMGRAIEKAVSLDGHSILHIFSSENIKNLKTLNHLDIDLAIEFSTPQSAYENIYQLLDSNIPVISGTTGWLDKKNEIDTFCKRRGGTFFYATNFSIGMNLLFLVNKQMANLINSRPEFKITIEETHHTQKKDKPSGTAITLATDIINSVNHIHSWCESPIQDPTAIPINSIRLANTPGIHKIKYESPMEMIEFSHTAFSRDVFAHGVMAVAKWINGKKGVLTMEDFFRNVKTF